MSAAAQGGSGSLALCGRASKKLSEQFLGFQDVYKCFRIGFAQRFEQPVYLLRRNNCIQQRFIRILEAAPAFKTGRRMIGKREDDFK